MGLTCHYCSKPIGKGKFCDKRCSTLHWRSKEALDCRAKIVGNTYGCVKVLSLSELVGKGKQRLWNVQCLHCKKNGLATTSALTLNRASCRCRNASGQTNKKWKGHGAISGRYWSSLQNSAKARGISFRLTIEEAWKVFVNQDGKCALTGLELSFGDLHSPDEQRERSASVDRIDAKAGYSMANIHWTHKIVNLMRRDMTIANFIEWCAKVSAYKHHHE